MKLKRNVSAAAAGALVSALLVPLTPGIAGAEELHNVTYRARVDGIARGALITYKISDTQVNSSDPTMLPGRTFEANAVLDDPTLAGMRVSIQWPYSANLHCEILVDDNIVAQADQFIGPRLTPANDDPDYGALTCGAPLINAIGTGSVVEPPATVPAPDAATAPSPDAAATAPSPDAAATVPSTVPAATAPTPVPTI
jgi:hypothetical protein